MHQTKSNKTGPEPTHRTELKEYNETKNKQKHNPKHTRANQETQGKHQTDTIRSTQHTNRSTQTQIKANKKQSQSQTSKNNETQRHARKS